ncbi:Transcription elongation factor TFIIS [Linum perenne]
MGSSKEDEKRLLELLHAAKKAAEGGEESRCVDALSRLKDFPVTVQALVSTQVGKQLRPLTKHACKDIHQLASDIFQTWKSMFLEQTNSSKNAAPAEHKKLAKPSDSTIDNKRTSNHKADKLRIATPPQPLKPQTPDSASPALRNFTVPKCNDPTRNKIREQLCEAMCKVSSETDGEMSNRVNACDLVRVAVEVESVMFREWGGSTGDQKAKYRSIIFNIKDGKNPDFRRKVLLGQFKPEQIVSLNSMDMASDARQRENEKIEKKALLDCEIGGAPKATTDQFKCTRCGQRKTTYYQMQTRSADEPMTTYVTCVNCNKHWKFC